MNDPCLCNNVYCEAQATHAVYWPDKPRRHYCEPCTARAVRAAEAMGFELITEELPPTTAGAVCE
jgi:hypothetical protein